MYTSLSVCPISEHYMRGGIGFGTKGKAVIGRENVKIIKGYVIYSYNQNGLFVSCYVGGSSCSF